jgi:hypothetical protein
MQRMLVSEATHACSGAPDVAVDESGHGLVDEQGIAAIEEKVELLSVCGLFRRRWCWRRRGRSLSAHEAESSQGLPLLSVPRTLAGDVRTFWPLPGMLTPWPV